MRFIPSLWIVFAVCALATQWEFLEKFVRSFGIIFVAVTAVWKDQFIALVSPAGAKVNLLQDCEKCPPEPEPYRHVILHGRVWATNADRPLVNARVLFNNIKYDDEPPVILPVPFQFPWAPSESNLEKIPVGKDYEIFDLGMISMENAPFDPDDRTPGAPIEPVFTVARRDFQGGFPLENRHARKTATVFFFVRADNLREDHHMKLEVDVLKNIYTLKEWGTEY